jgi:3-hydroxy-9,10-secoandrosta-1,3,5(10)-triene-9,17-dione monooxygenase reductase component
MIPIEEFKKSLGRFASGVTLITYRDESLLSGITVSSFTSLSLDPPLILFNIQKKASSHDKLLQSKGYAVHILSNEQESISNQFSSPKTDRNEVLNSLHPKFIDDIPVLENSLSYLVCSNHKTYDGGDHTIFIGMVNHVYTNEDKSPLLYYNKGYRKFSE